MVVLRRLGLALAVLVWGGVAHAQAGARADVISGRVTGPDSQPLPQVVVGVTDVTTKVAAAGRTDAQGRYSVTMEGRSGTYTVQVRVMGMRPEERRVTRTDRPESLVADFRLVLAPQPIAAMRVQARRARPQRESQFPLQDIGSSDNFSQGFPVPPGVTDLASILGAIPGLTAIPGQDGQAGGFSALGMGADQNNTTLNGLQVGLADLPRGAVFTRVSTTSSDPSRGGFSGGLAQVFAFPGNNFRGYTATLSLEDPALQATDRPAASLGQEFRNVIANLGVSGPFVEDHAFFNVSMQVSRRTSDLAHLFGLDPLALRQVGLSADSVARFESLAGAAGIPLVAPGAPGSLRTTTALSMLGRFDLSPAGTKAANLVTNLTYSRGEGLGIGTTSPVAAGGRNTSLVLSGVYTWSTYFGQGFLQEFKGSLTGARRETEPYLRMPAGRVRVTSTLADGTSGISTLSLGGSSGMPDENTSGAWEVQSATSWVSNDNKHRLKLAASVRRDHYAFTREANALGTWTYNSLDDFEAGIPGAFSRSLAARTGRGAAYNAFVSIGDAWRVNDALSFQGGLRLEGNRFARLPAYNPALERDFGLRTDRGPNRVHLSPRLGFNYTANLPPRNAPVPFFNARRIWTLRGSIGEYRNQLAPTLLGAAFDATGLPGGWQQLSCFGTAVPVPDWDRLAGDPSASPSACADGTTGSSLVDARSGVFVFDRAYDASRSWRANLSFSRQVARVAVSIEGLVSLNLDQPSPFDVNFAGVPRFSLADDGRPVFVPEGSIDPRSGTVSPRLNRLSDLYGAVSVQRSDLRSSSRQLTITFNPTRFTPTFGWTLNYVLLDARGERRGFSFGGAGDPRAIESGPTGFASRHQVNLSAFTRVLGSINVRFMQRLSSGMAFTPTVSGDVNGDGVGGDRAFVPPPGAAATDPSLGAAISALVAGAPSYARACLERQFGRIAGVNSCRGPWTSATTIQLSHTQGRLGIPRRMNLTMSLWNPLGGVDQLLNGRNVRGWGQAGFADATLLYVNGFDAAARRFRYEVNPRFGDARASRTAFRTPFRVSLDARIQLGPDADRQQLARELAQGRTRKGERMRMEQFRANYTRSPFNPVPQIMQLRDSMHLTTPQLDSINATQRRYQASLDSLWTPTAQWVGSQGDRFDLDEGLARVRETRRAMLPLTERYLAALRGILRPDQIRILPDFVQQFFDPSFTRSMGEVFVIFR